MLCTPGVVLAAAVATTLIAGCATKTSDTPIPQPPAVAAKPATPPPAAKPAAPVTPQPAPQTTSKAVPPVAKTPALTARAPKPAAPPVAAPAAPGAPAKLDLNALKEQLKATKAIGVFTKISLKNQVDDLMGQFRDYYQGKSKLTMTDLRRSYNRLMMKVLSLLQTGDPPLASDIVSSREAIWGVLVDPKKFAALQV